MPRTFSRGKKWTAQSVFDVSGYLSLDEEDLFLNRLRPILCIDTGIIEQDVFQFFFDLRKNLNEIRNFQEVPNIPGITPRINTLLIDEVTIRQILQAEINRVRRPEPFV